MNKRRERVGEDLVLIQELECFCRLNRQQAFENRMNNNETTCWEQRKKARKESEEDGEFAAWS